MKVWVQSPVWKTLNAYCWDGSTKKVHIALCLPGTRGKETRPNCRVTWLGAHTS